MDIIQSVVCFGIFEKSTKEIIGAVGAGEHDDLNETEIFFQLILEFRNSGYATEASKAISKWAVSNYEIPYIIGTAEESNIASQKVLLKSGYEFIESKELLVHITNEKYKFKYYRYC